MDIAKISMVVRRGGSPDLAIEVNGIRIVIPRLDKMQRYELSSLIYGGRTKIELPCEVNKNE